MESVQSIPQYFTGKNVFITGGTGFMGRVLIEKLLRSCPDIGTVYVLIRSKKGVSSIDRWKKAIDCELFDKLKECNKAALNKVKVIEGDVSELELGLNQNDRNELIEKVSIVYHSAATVRFNEVLNKAILMNVRGTREMCILVLEMKNIKVFMHVSTAYCHTGQKIVEEKIYPARGDPTKAIKLAETMDVETIKLITSKYCEHFPNTYTFTKRLSETLVIEMCQNKVPTIIFRPTIVAPSIDDPIKGWVDNFNGPIGINLAVAKGLLRTINGDANTLLDYIPVDSTISAIIKATWHYSTSNNKDIKVYNCSNENLNAITIADSCYRAVEVLLEANIWPEPLFYVNLCVTTGMWYWINLYIFQILPSVFADGILKILGKKTRFIFIQQKMLTNINPSIGVITMHWRFTNYNFIELDDYLLPEDNDTFSNKIDGMDVDAWYCNGLIGITKLIKENVNNMRENTIKYKRLKYIYYLWNSVAMLIIGKIFYSNFLLPFVDKFYDYILSL